MLILLPFVLLFLVPPSQGTNILVTVPFPGSHYMAMADLGVLLANQGYNVTMVSLIPDDRYTTKHENFTMLKPHIEYDNPEWFDELVYRCVANAIGLGRDYDMYADVMFADPLCRKGWVEIYANIIDFYSHDVFSELIEEGKFDLILSEERTALPVLTVVNKKDIPVIAYSPEVAYELSRKVQNLPMLLASEPGLMIQIYNKQKPGFWYRLKAWYNFVKLSKLEGSILEMMKPLFDKHGVTSADDLYKNIQLYLINDHLAFSFPYQIPNNVLQVGGSSLKEGRPLTGDIQEFVQNQKNPIILVSMGTYADITWMKQFKIFLDVLERMDVSVIMKVNKETKHLIPKLSNKFHLSTWVPQRDLLGSGAVKLFISHCGNNGKIESIYYKVPILCTPLFADQNLNSYVVHYRGFGEMLLQEETTESSFEAIVNMMLTNHDSYVENLSQAVDIFENDPVKAKAQIIYYVELLLKYKKLDYLVNKIALEQSSVEMYHLDIILFLISCMVLSCIIIYRVVLKIASYSKQQNRDKKDQ